MNKNLFLSVVRTQTAKLASVLSGEASSGLTEEEQGIKDAYNAIGCGGSQADYRRLIEKQFRAKGKVLNPDTFRDNDDRDGYTPCALSAFVPLTCRNGHNYPIGEVSVFVDSSRSGAYNLESADTGNTMDEDLTSIRPATEEEIEQVYNHAKKILKYTEMEFSDYDMFDAEDTPENVEAIVALL